MAEKVELIIRTATRDRENEVGAFSDATVQELLDSAQKNWNLPSDYEYVVRCERLGTQLNPSQSLAAQGIQQGDVLEIQPLADAGLGH